MVQWFVSPAATGGVSSIPLETTPPNMNLQFDITSAFLYYALLGVADPRNLADAKGIMRVTGLSYAVSLSLASAFGALAVGAALTMVDAKHKYPGGFDDTKLGKKIFSARKLSSLTVTNPLRNLMYEPNIYEYDTYYS